jgi:pSer/pThr/pTyr-binding forkhead associated (FHA) protein
MPAQKQKNKSQGEVRGVLYNVDDKSQDAIKLRRDATIFGREKGDVLLGDNEVSSTHFQIQNINGEFFLFDMNSTNGTLVNKVKTIKSELKDGDIITAGKTTFRFAIESDANVRHINTIFKAASSKAGHHKTSLVDTLIEGEIRQRKGYSLNLKITYADKTFEEVQLPQTQVYLGRATTFGQFESDPEISRKHLLVKMNDHQEVFIEDQGSTNGSFVNGNKISGMVKIGPADRVRIGAIELLVSVKSS